MTGKRSLLSEPASPDELSLYLHVPFCTKKCPYCHFYVIRNRNLGQEEWLESIKKELELLELSKYFKKQQNNYQFASIGQDFFRELSSIYFGGGTPSLLSPRIFEEVLEIIKGLSSYKKETEITIEANPEDLSKEKLLGFAKAGINRLSIGLQSIHQEELRQLGREPIDLAYFSKMLFFAKECGFHSISLDVIFDLPNQTLDSWIKTLNYVVKQPIDHISIYNLLIEEQTLFWTKKEQLKKTMPNQELTLSMMEQTDQLLSQASFNNYEISAYAKTGHESHHNSGYWRGRDFLGLGPSAYSYMNGQRFCNCSSFKKYQKSLEQGILPIEHKESLDHKKRQAELLAIALRLRKGVNLELFQKYRGKLSAPLQQSLSQCLSMQWLEKKGSIIRLTPKGRRFYNRVGQELIII